MDENSNLSQSIPFWRQLRWTLILFFVMLAVLPVLITVTITLNREIQQTETQVIGQLESVAELKRDQIISWLDHSQAAIDLFLIEPGRKERLAMFSQAVSVSDGGIDLQEQAELDEILQRAAEATPFFEEFFLYSPKGLIVAASNETQLGKIVTTQPYFKPSITQEDYIQAPYYAVGSDELTIFLTHSLLDEQTREVEGVLAGRLDLDTLGGIMLRQAELGDTGETYLVSLANNYLLTPGRLELDQAHTQLNRAYHSEGIDRALAGRDGSGNYQNHRTPAVAVFGVYRWIPELQVALMAEVEEAEALTSARQSQRLSALLAGVTVILAIFFGLIIAGRISKPIASLARVAALIAAGDLGLQAKINQHNEIGLLATSFNKMTAQLRTLIGSLEDQVASRTQRLEVVATLSERVNAILDLDQLLITLVEQVKESFGYYHAHVYLIEDETQNLVIAAGAGEAGAQMKAAGHHIPLDAPTSLVARAARTGQTVWVDDVRDVADWLQNPLLPETYAEMAVPITLDRTVVGVLDVQEDTIAGLDESDANLLRSLANQVAIAIRNARTLAQTQSALDEVQRLQNLYTVQAWEAFTRIQPKTAFEIKRVGLPALQETATPEVDQALAEDQTVRATNEDGPRQNALATPLKVRDAIIGVLGIHNEDPDREWTDEEVALIEAVGRQMSLAIENARLFADSQRRAAREEVIANLTRAVWSGDNIESVLNNSVTQLGEILQARKVVLSLGARRQIDKGSNGQSSSEQGSNGRPANGNGHRNGR